MSVYFTEGKGWRYDFTLRGRRYTQAGYSKKAEAIAARAERKKELNSPIQEIQIPTDMGFLELVNRRLDHVQTHNSPQHYAEYKSRAKQWIKRWGRFLSKEVTEEMIGQFVELRAKVSRFTGNREIKCLRATFNWGAKKKLITHNPASNLESFPDDKQNRYTPQLEDVVKVLSLANQEERDYLLVICDTLARGIEVNRLKWDDVRFPQKTVTLWTRKKKGGHMRPTKVPMTERLFKVFSRRFAERKPGIPWVFWHNYWDNKTGEKRIGPYIERKRFMKTLCKKAGVDYFRFHALRRFSASMLDSKNVPIGSIQALLGHEDRKTTETYLENVRGAEQQAVSILEQATSEFDHETAPMPPPEHGIESAKFGSGQEKAHTEAHTGAKVIRMPLGRNRRKLLSA